MKIYLLTITATGKSYVGKTTGSLGAARLAHIRQARKGAGLPLWQDIMLHGKDAIQMELLEECPKYAGEERQDWHVMIENSLEPYGYNKLRGQRM